MTTQGIPYTTSYHPRSRSIKIKISHKGEVIVTAPPRTPARFIEQSVQRSASWIQQQLIAITASKKMLSPTDSTVLLFGEQYEVQQTDDQQLSVGVRLAGKTILVKPVLQTPQSIQRGLDTFFKSVAEKYILPRTHQLSQKMEITFSAIQLRQQSTRWGSCSSHGNLQFNWRLVHAPPAVIDYVIIHELAHRKEMNHSSRFWAVVEKYDPEFQKHRGWLKREGRLLL